MAAVTVDEIIGELTLRYQKYIDDANRVIAVNKEMRQSMADAGGDDRAADQSTSRKIATRKKLTDAEKAAAAEEKRAAKEKADVIKQAAREEAAAVKAAEKEKQQAIAASERAARQAAERQARLDASSAKRVIHSPSVPRASGWENGINPFQGAANAAGGSVSRQNAEMRESTINLAKQEEAADREVNNLLIQRIELQERLKVANTEEAEIIRQQLTELSLTATYERAGLEAKEAAIRLDRELAVIEQQRATRAAEIVAANQTAITQLGLQAAKTAAADKAEAIALGDQIAAIRQVEAYKARGMSQAEAEAKVAGETLALEENVPPQPYQGCALSR